MVDLLASWGVNPDSVTGHSSGEIAAAYATGALSLEDAMAVAYYRGVASSHMQQNATAKGAMMAVGMSKEDVEPLIAALTTGKITVACINSPQSVTVSGDVEAIDELKAVLAEKNVFARRLAVEVAYHSHHMALVAEEYESAISGIRTVEAANTEFFSSVTGRKVTAAELGPRYWVSNLLGQVKFANSVREMCLETIKKKTKWQSQGGRVNVLIEIGPHSALAGPIKQILQGEPRLKDASINYISALVRKESAVTTMLNLAGKLAVQSYPLDFSAINRPMGWESHNVIVDLPPYSWNHSNVYWAEPRLSKTLRNRISPRTDLLGALDRNSNPLESRWRNHLRLSEIPWARHHRIQSNIVYPASGFIAMAIEAACEHAKGRSSKAIAGYKLREITFGTALLIPDQEEGVETLISLKRFNDSLRRPGSSWEEFCVFSVTLDDNWTEHCRGLISVQFTEENKEIFEEDSKIEDEKALSERLGSIEEACKEDVEISGFYERLRNMGLDYGETFANVAMVRVGLATAVGTIVIPDTAAVMPAKYEYPFVIHPTTLDSVLHLVFAAKYERGPVEEPAIPVFADEIFVSHNVPRQNGRKLSVHTLLDERDRRSFKSSVWVMDPDQPGCEPLVSFSDLHWKILAKDVQKSSAHSDERTAYAFKWEADIDMLSGENADRLCGGPGNGVGLGRIYQVVSRWLSLLGHKNPHLSIMAMDSGSSGAAVQILQALSAPDPDHVPSFGKFTLTGTNPTMLETIQTQLASARDIMVFKELNAEVDPLKQGFSECSFDVVIAVHSLDGVKSIDEALKNIKKLIRQNGRLILVEANREFMASRETLDALTDRLVRRAPLSPEEWQQKLEKAGYGNVDCVVRDRPGESEDEVSMIVARASRTAPVAAPEVVLIVQGEDDRKDDGNGVDTTRLVELLARSGTRAETAAFSAAEPAGKTCIVLGDLDGAIASDPSEQQFETIKKILLKSNGVLWVTRGGTVSSRNPNANVVTGLARTARSENDGSTTVTLDLDGEEPLSPAAASGIIYSLFKHCFTCERSSESNADLEYAERRGVLMIPRIVEDHQLNRTISSISNRVPVDQLFHQAGRHLRLEVGSKYLEDLYFVDDERSSRGLEDDGIEIEVKAIGLNTRDMLIASGEIKMEPLGVECSGIVRAVGRSVHNLVPGDRVAGCGLGTISSSYWSRASAFQKIPEYMSFETAASLPTAYITAYHVVHHLARVSRQDIVLVHSATAVLGEALIDLCVNTGAEIFVSVVTLEHKKSLLSKYAIPEDHILHSEDANLKRHIMRLTYANGLDVVLNCSAGEALRLAWDCIAPYGRFVDLGSRNVDVNTRLEMLNFRRNASFAVFDILFFMEQKTHDADTAWADVMDLLRRKAINCPSNLRIFPIHNIKTALQALKRGEGNFKPVVVTSPDAIVKVSNYS